MQYPKVVIIGKPNVGKSTLFNRLCKKKIAIVTDIAGTTRDRKEYLVELNGLKFTLVDTAGWEEYRSKQSIQSLMMSQTESGILEADLVLFVVDGRNYLSADDLEFADFVRKSNKPVALVVNKSESKISLSTNDLLSLGFGEPVFVSAEHALGLDALSALLANFIKDPIEHDEREIDNKLLLAIIGRPNAGKSTIFNALVGSNRSITAPESGTTRDAISYDIMFDKTEISLIDTAGLRKKSKVYEEIEKLSTGQTITAVRRANVVALVVDSTQGLEQQDLAIAHMAFNEGKGLFLIFNKHDLVTDRKALSEDIEYLFEHSLTDVLNIPVIHTNAIKGINIDKIITTALDIHQNWSRQISTSKLNQWLQETTHMHQPSFASDGRRIKFKYITQVKSRPPTFKAFVNLPNAISSHYSRYLNHSLQKHFNFIGVPVRILFSSTENPYGDRSKK